MIVLRAPSARGAPSSADALSPPDRQGPWGGRRLLCFDSWRAACASAADLAEAAAQVFAAQVDAAIGTSFPGLGLLSGARVLGEDGDDRIRFADAAPGLVISSKVHRYFTGRDVLSTVAQGVDSF